VLLGGLAVASFTDIRWTRIPNALTFPMMLLGFVTAIAEHHPTTAVYGWLLATAVYFPLFALGISRAGDAKLMMAIGALVGPRETAETLAWTAIVYLPVQLAVLAMRGKLSNLVATARYQADQLLGRPAGPSPEMTMGVTGPIIAAAGALAWATDWMARWVS
jgi:Flp pilus assembly protein protease CpaA